MNEKIIIASGPVIVEDNKVLLNKHGNDSFWKFCGGRIKESDNLIEAAQQTVKEEMGLEIRITNPRPFVMHVNKPGNEKIDVILVHFLAERLNEVNPGPDTDEWDWFSINNLPQDLAPNIQPTLQYFKFM